MLTCRDAVDLLLDFLEATLDAGAVSRLERHLAGCPPCVAYLRTYRRTPALVGELTRAPMPEEMKARLREFLRAQTSTP